MLRIPGENRLYLVSQYPLFRHFCPDFGSGCLTVALTVRRRRCSCRSRSRCRGRCGGCRRGRGIFCSWRAWPSRDCCPPAGKNSITSWAFINNESRNELT